MNETNNRQSPTPKISLSEGSQESSRLVCRHWIAAQLVRLKDRREKIYRIIKKLEENAQLSA